MFFIYYIYFFFKRNVDGTSFKGICNERARLIVEIYYRPRCTYMPLRMASSRQNCSCYSIERIFFSFNTPVGRRPSIFFQREITQRGTNARSMEMTYHRINYTHTKIFSEHRVFFNIITIGIHVRRSRRLFGPSNVCKHDVRLLPRSSFKCMVGKKTDQNNNNNNNKRRVCRRRPHSIIFEFDRRRRRERPAPSNYTVFLFERTIIPVAFTVYKHALAHRKKKNQVSL